MTFVEACNEVQNFISNPVNKRKLTRKHLVGGKIAAEIALMQLVNRLVFVKPNISFIAKLLGVSRWTVLRQLEFLRSRGLVKLIKQKNRPTLISIDVRQMINTILSEDEQPAKLVAAIEVVSKVRDDLISKHGDDYDAVLEANLNLVAGDTKMRSKNSNKNCTGADVCTLKSAIDKGKKKFDEAVSAKLENVEEDLNRDDSLICRGAPIRFWQLLQRFMQTHYEGYRPYHKIPNGRIGGTVKHFLKECYEQGKTFKEVADLMEEIIRTWPGRFRAKTLRIPKISKDGREYTCRITLNPKFDWEQFFIARNQIISEIEGIRSEVAEYNAALAANEDDDIVNSEEYKRVYEEVKRLARKY